mmetsp:Transcript_52006/g.52396  ORF Transcript_52006/g.52396 Transcript_52006/m.52396 type:complete len:95 (+) Transcript_52006:107-391(+)
MLIMFLLFVWFDSTLHPIPSPIARPTSNTNTQIPTTTFYRNGIPKSNQTSTTDGVDPDSSVWSFSTSIGYLLVTIHWWVSTLGNANNVPFIRLV